MADEKMREKFPNFKRPDLYTWNHAGKPGSRKMELIFTGYHERVAHSGNAAEVRRAARLNKALFELSIVGGPLLARDAIDKIRLIASAKENIVYELEDLISYLRVLRSNNRPSRAEVAENELRALAATRIYALIAKYDGNTTSLRMILTGWWYRILGKR